MLRLVNNPDVHNNSVKNDEDNHEEEGHESLLIRASCVTLSSARTTLPIFDIRWAAAPVQVKILVSRETAWPPFSIIHYTFKLPNDPKAAQILMDAQPAYVNRSIALTELSPETTAIVTNSLRWWQNTVNLQFRQDEGTHPLPIFGFTHADNHTPVVAGYGQMGHSQGSYTTGIGFNQNYLDSLARSNWTSPVHHLVFHETGHTMISLTHPFDPPHIAPCAYQNTTSYTVMAYENEIEPLGNKTLISVTPMPADMDAAQYLYGKNMAVRTGNDVYLLKDYIPAESASAMYKTIASLPWDAGGRDRLSASSICADVTLDIRRYGRSILPDGYVMTPNIQIEDVTGGHGRNIIFLNELDNHVDVTSSQHTTLIIDPLHSGRDTVSGFNPQRDQIVLAAQPGQTLAWKQVEMPHLDGASLSCRQNATRLDFDSHNSITLFNVSADQMRNDTVQIDKQIIPAGSPGQESATALPSSQSMMRDILAVLPGQLCSDFFDAFQAGAALAFIESLSEEAMRYYRCSDFSIYLAKRLLYSLYIIYNCAILTNGPGILTTELLKSLSFDDTFAQYAGLAVTGGIALFQNMTPLGLARTAVSFAGGFAGSLFTMWAGNMIKSSIESSCRQQKINAPSQPVSTDKTLCA